MVVRRSRVIGSHCVWRNKPKDTQSPCFAYHPYGALSDLHVEVLLNAVLCKPSLR